MTRIARIALCLLLAFPVLSLAHDVPDEVRIRAFLKPDGNRMTILVRIPANALIDILFPTLPGSPWLDLKQANAAAAEGARIWVADQIRLYEDDMPLPEPDVVAVCMTQLPDGDFSSYEKALHHISQGGPLSDERLTQDGAAVDIALETPIHSPFAKFSIETGLARVGVRVTISLAFLPASGGIRQFEFEGNPERLHLDPNLWNAIIRSVRDGYRHFFSASDYFLLLVSLALLFRDLPQLSRFGVSLFLSASIAFFWAAYGLWVSSLEAEIGWGILVGAFVVYMAFEAIVRQEKPEPQPLLSVLAGFVLGTGYWFAFRPQMQFGGTHKFASTLGFAFGVQGTQIVILVAAATATRLLLRTTRNPRVIAIIGAAFVLRNSWHRLLDRARSLDLSAVKWPGLTPSGIVTVATLLSIALWMARSKRSQPRPTDRNAN